MDLHDFPNQIQVHFKIPMNDFVSHASDSFPRNRRVVLSKLFTEISRGFSDHLNVADDSVLSSAIRIEEGAPVSAVIEDSLGRIYDVTNEMPISIHRGTASRNISLSVPSAPSDTTSTLHPRSSSKSCWTPTRSSKLRPFSNRTRTSRSLLGPSSPRATEPKMRKFRAPCCEARRSISRLRSRTCCKFMRTSFTDCTVQVCCSADLGTLLRPREAPLRPTHPAYT